MRTVSTAWSPPARTPSSGCPSGCRRRSASWPAPRRRGCWRSASASGWACLHEIMEAEVDEVVGPKGKHNPERGGDASWPRGRRGDARRAARAGRAGRARGRADGERRGGACRPTGTSPTRDPLTDVVLERMLAGVSTRRYARTGEPVGERRRGRSRARRAKSAVSREFVSRTREHLDRAACRGRWTTCAWRC